MAEDKSNITAGLAKRAADLQLQDAIECKPTIAEGMEVEQLAPENLTDDQKKFWIEKQAEARRRLSHQKQLIWNLQILPKAPRRHRRVGMRIFLTSRHSLHNRTGQPPWPERRRHDLFWRKSVSTQRKRKHFLLVHYVNAYSVSQQLWSSIRDRTEYDLTQLPP